MGSLLPPVGCQGLNLGHQAWWQMPLPAMVLFGWLVVFGFSCGRDNIIYNFYAISPPVLEIGCKQLEYPESLS